MMDSEFVLHSLTDSASYNLPDELFFGSLRSTIEFTRLQLLGDGSTASVYTGKDKFNKIHALKFFKTVSSGSSIAKDLYREISILKSLNHDNIVKLQEVVIGASPNSLCLVLEFCPYPLTYMIENYPDDIPHNQIKCICVQMFKGLNYLHKNYIIHRDIKPGNLMISNNNRLKIIDFGLSRRFTYPEKASTPNVMTRFYEAPEILFECPNYGPEIDIWSAACVTAELFYRRPFLPGESQIGQINLIIDLIGTPSPNIWPGFVKSRTYKNLRLKNQHFSNLGTCLMEIGASSATEFFQGLFVYDPDKRKTAEECLQDDWFQRAPFPSEEIEIPPECVPKYETLTVTL